MYKYIIRPLLFRFSTDSVHESTVRLATKASRSDFARGLTRMTYGYKSTLLQQELFGLTFRNPVGLAAGFDKNGTFPALMEALGFGFTEIGSITARASAGNPHPRSFRLADDASLINRMGLNNDGASVVTSRLKRKRWSIPTGVNIAKTHDPGIFGQDALDDYNISYLLAREVADYITVNISCPNTREGKTFETPETLDKLLQTLLTQENERQTGAATPPLLVKVSADLDPELLRELLDVTTLYPVSGFVATNTSVSRDQLATSPQLLEEIGRGGLSGRAIQEKSNDIIRLIYEHTGGTKPIIGVGGIFSASDAIRKIRAGADLLQIYTGLIYEGPSLVRKINKGIAEHMRRENLRRISEIRG